MSAVTRLADFCTGHGNCHPRSAITASRNVQANGIPVHRVGDGWTMHCDHAAVLAAGARTVFVNGVPVGRVGDPISCGSLVATGSHNVFAEAWS